MIIVKLRKTVETEPFHGIQTYNHFFVRFKKDYFLPLPVFISIAHVSRKIKQTDVENIIDEVRERYAKYIRKKPERDIKEIIIKEPEGLKGNAKYETVAETVLLKSLGLSDEQVKQTLGEKYNHLILKTVNLGLAYYLSLMYKQHKFMFNKFTPKHIVERPFDVLFSIVKHYYGFSAILKCVTTILIKTTLTSPRYFGLISTPKGDVPYEVDLVFDDSNTVDFDEHEEEINDPDLFDCTGENWKRIVHDRNLFSGVKWYQFYGYFGIYVWSIDGVKKIVESRKPPLMPLEVFARFLSCYKVTDEGRFIRVRDVDKIQLKVEVVSEGECVKVRKVKVNVKFLELSGVLLVMFDEKVYRLLGKSVTDETDRECYFSKYEKSKKVVVKPSKACKPVILECVESFLL